jgi:hypothetical protein
MKKAGLLLVLVSVIALVAIAYAQDPSKTGDQEGWNFCPYCGSYIGPRGGYGMGPGMMGGGYVQSEECQKFLDDTSKQRKELYNKRYEYSEAFRNPKTSPEEIAKLEKEIRDLQGEIYKKAQKVPQGCWY